MSRTKRSPAAGAKHMLRRPKTQAERKLSCAANEDGIPWRAKRNAKNLPSAREDQVIASLYEKPKRKG